MYPKEGMSMEDQAARDWIILVFDGYLKQKEEGRLYNKESIIPEEIIKLYYKTTKNPQFTKIYSNFKRNYIYNESRIDENITEAERAGLAKVYDYINNYDFSTKKFDIFVEGLKIHSLLYSECADPSFGGLLRQGTALLLNSNVEVPSADKAKRFFQSFIGKEIPKVDMDNPLSLFDYINSCIYITTELIKAQPFADGNKRTFRSLLNLMFKQYNLPPVYVKTKERGEYKDALMDALLRKDYIGLNQFYYYKICDSIYDLDILPELKEQAKPNGNQKVKKK